MVQLAGLGGAGSWAWDINASGQVVGGSGTRAARWDFAADGTQTVTDLGLLSKTVRRMLALAINGQGEIVGNAEFTSRGTAFLYKTGKLYDLATRCELFRLRRPPRRVHAWPNFPKTFPPKPPQNVAYNHWNDVNNVSKDNARARQLGGLDGF